MKSGIARLAALMALLVSTPLVEGQIPDKVSLTPVFGTDGANKMTRPVWMGEIPGQKGSFLVLDQGYSTGTGVVWVFEPQAGGQYARKEFHSLPVRQNANEMGLLGCAFHPKFTENRKYYLYLTQPRGSADTNVIIERVADATFKKDAGAASRPVFAQRKDAINHNGGTIGFGKDGYLYVGVGDDAIGSNGQSRANTLAAILRIDVDNPADGKGYGIPSDNPFIGEAGVRKEIFVYGLRNPWKWSFDPLNDDLWIGDVGEENIEEISIAKKGDNMGWAQWEGNRCLNSSTCKPEGKTPPLKTFNRDSAQSITGGVVYRGNPSSPFYGAFFFGDYIKKHVWAMTQSNGKMTALSRVALAPTFVTSFALDSENNVYVMGFEPGTVYRLVHEGLKPGPVMGRRGEAAATPPYTVRKGGLVLSAGMSGVSRVEVLDLKGKRVAESRPGAMPKGGIIRLAPGSYHVRLHSGDKARTETEVIP